MKIKNENGITGIDISISVVVIFIFVSLISVLIYNFNISSKEATRKSTALELAIAEIEEIKRKKIDDYTNFNNDNAKNQPIDGNDGFFKTITVEDYTDIDGNEDKTSGLVKKVTVTISYQSNGETKEVKLSTMLTKES